MQGNRDHIDGMAAGSQKVMNQVLTLIDTYDLYGSVAYPKKHQQSDISDIYTLPKHTRGVFTNVALQEPFGLTVIEVPFPPKRASVAVAYILPANGDFRTYMAPWGTQHVMSAAWEWRWSIDKSP